MIRNISACIVFCVLGMGCPNTQRVKTNITDYDQALRRLVEKKRQVKRVSGRAKLRIYKNGKKKRTAKIWFHIQRPNKLHFQVTGSFNQTGAVVTTDGKMFAFHQVLAKEFLRGKAASLPLVLKDYLPTGLSTVDFISVLLGEIPFVAKTKGAWKEKSVQELKYLLQEKDLLQEIWLMKDFLRFSGGLIKSKRNHLTLKYRSSISARNLPKVIEFHIPSKREEYRWIYSTVDINPKQKDELFVQKTPSGVKVLDY